MVSPKPWQVESFVKLLLRLLICFVAGAVVAGILRGWLGDRVAEAALLPLLISIVCLHGAGLVAIGLFVREHQITWAEAFGFRCEPGWALLLGGCAAVVALPACWGLQSAMAQLLTRCGFEAGEQEAVRLLRLADLPWKQVVLGVFAIGLAPVVEEFFFRGIIYPLLKQNGYPRLALWGTAFLFALIHGNLAVLVPLFALAIGLALLYEWTNNLLACIVVHSLFNTANFVLLFVLKNTGQLPGSP